MLSRHFSPDIKRGIISLGLNSFDEIDEYLRNIDSTYATNLSIRVAIGGKQQRIKSQVLLPVTVRGANIQLDVKCLIVSDLNREILFGLDWLKEYKAIIDFDESIFRFSHNSKSIVVNFGASYSEGKMSLNNVAALSVQIKHSSPNVRHFYTKEEISAVAEKAGAEEVNRKILGELLGEFADIFSECPGQVRSYEHSIDMIDEKPFHCSNYPIPFAYRDEVRSQVEEMLVWGVIERSKSEHISPLVTVKKKDGSVRICLDARTLNKKMRKDFVNPLNVNE